MFELETDGYQYLKHGTDRTYGTTYGVQCDGVWLAELYVYVSWKWRLAVGMILGSRIRATNLVNTRDITV